LVAVVVTMAVAVCYPCPGTTKASCCGWSLTLLECFTGGSCGTRERAARAWCGSRKFQAAEKALGERKWEEDSALEALAEATWAVEAAVAVVEQAQQRRKKAERLTEKLELELIQTHMTQKPLLWVRHG
jgi:hypothetical protein